MSSEGTGITGAGPELVLFDAGGTLVLINPDRFNAFISGWDLPSVTADSLFTAHFQAMSDFSQRLMNGDAIDFPWWVEHFFGLAGLPSRPDLVRAFAGGPGMWNHAIPGALPAVMDLLARGYRVAVVSNSDGSVTESLQVAGFGDLFELVIDSANVGISKPDPGIFRLALDALDVAAGNAWYVGDSSYHDIGGAKAAGLAAAVLIDPLSLGPPNQLSVRSIAELPQLIEETR
jgi:putative hydrolase of the HAD superfamily